MNRTTCLVAVCLAIVIPTLPGHGQEPKAKEMDVLMQRKLANAQKVLEGIALNDFEKIAKHAEDLMEVSKAAEWKVLKTPQYETHSNDFRRNAEALTMAAKTKNIDAAALAYVDLTLTCVKCHKHVREVRRARVD